MFHTTVFHQISQKTWAIFTHFGQETDYFYTHRSFSIFFLKTEATFTYLIVLEFICGPLFLHTLVFQKYYQKTEAIFTYSSLLSQSRGWLFLHSPVFYLYLFLYLKLYLFFWKKTWKTKVCNFRITPRIQVSVFLVLST